MSAPILTIDDPQDSVLKEHVTTLTLARADPLAAALVPKFEALIADLSEVAAIRIGLVIAVATAKAKAFYVDSQLNSIVDDLVAALQKITKKNRKDPLWQVYFGNLDPSTLKRPVLRGQLSAMKVWPGSLSISPHDELKAIDSKLAGILPNALTAEQEIATAEQSLLDFSSVGRWAQHITKANGERQSAWGMLAELPHTQPEQKLPAGYADLFFLHDTSRRGASTPRTAKEIAEEIAALEKDLASLRAQLDAAIAREKAVKDAAAEDAANRAALAVAEQEEADAAAKAEALRKKLNDGDKGKS